MSGVDRPATPTGVDVCATGARFLAGLGADRVAAVRAAHVPDYHGDCRGCRWQLATHWPCIHAVMASRASQLLTEPPGLG